MLGITRPWARGRPVGEVWKEIWDEVLRPLPEKVQQTGEASRGNDYPFFLERYGYSEKAYFDVSYDPVRDESGRAGGVSRIVSETTGRIVGVVQDITARRKLIDNPQPLLNELNHRVRNTLATVLSLARQTRCWRADDSGVRHGLPGADRRPLRGP